MSGIVAAATNGWDALMTLALFVLVAYVVRETERDG